MDLVPVAPAHHADPAIHEDYCVVIPNSCAAVRVGQRGGQKGNQRLPEHVRHGRRNSQAHEALGAAVKLAREVPKATLWPRKSALQLGSLSCQLPDS